MSNGEYFVTHSAGWVPCACISRELEDGSFEELSYDTIVEKLNKYEELKNISKGQTKKICELLEEVSILERKLEEWVE